MHGPRLWVRPGTPAPSSNWGLVVRPVVTTGEKVRALGVPPRAAQGQRVVASSCDRSQSKNLLVVRFSASHDGSALASASQRYLLKWSVPLGLVDVIEYGSNTGAGEHSRGCTPHPPESLAVVAGAKPRK